jgi:GNAT superfamily N-acetyltransferase
MAGTDTAVEFIPADLAPGDAKARELDPSAFDVARICSIDDPLFSLAYERLWTEFGPRHEMEGREVITRRLGWHPGVMAGNSWMRYEIIVVRRLGQIAAVRDHTAVAASECGAARAIVHLSHVLVDAAWRRTGLAGWLRAWPIQTARACLAAAGFSMAAPITLVAEMEHADPRFPDRLIRLGAYEKAGFKKVDPAVVNYFQPDFRPPEEIDAGGGPRPLPFGLILRRVGREQEQVIRGGETREIVECLYRMYATGFRDQDMAVARSSLRGYPGEEREVPLIPPSR